MKKLFFFAAAALAMLSAASCQKEPAASVEGGNAVVSLSVALPEAPQTRAIAQAENADIVYFEVWNSDWTKKLPVQDKDGNPFESAPVDVTTRRANIELTLVADQTYNFLFWAQNKDCGAYSWDQSEDGLGLKKVNIDYSKMAEDGNNDIYDAYYKRYQLKVNGAINETVVLYRPFAQLNFATERMTTSFGRVELKASSVTVTGLSTAFDLYNECGVEEDPANPVSVTFVPKDALVEISEQLNTNNKDYTWLTMDYMLMQGVSDLVEVEASFDLDMDVPVEHKIASVPLKKNYRTNIIGDVFAADAKLQIIIDQAFLKQDEDITVGVPEEIFDNDKDGVYNVEKPGHILWLSQESQNNKATFAGKTLNFTADIDMMGQGFLPINIWGDNVTVLGNGHKVFNFSVRGDSYRVGEEKSLEHAGLFGEFKGTITDLHVKDVLVEGNFSAGALVGYIYGSVKNCSATNVEINSIPYASIVDGTFIYDDANNVGGLIGYVGEGSYEITGNTVEGATITGYRCLGGLAGTVQKGVEVTDNNVTNSTITVDMAYVPYVDAPKTAYAGEIVGRMISADDLSDNSFDNVTITNLEVVTTAEEFQAALDAVANDPTKANIVVMPGTYEGMFTIKADGTTITGKEGAVVDCINLNGKKNTTLKTITFDAAGAQQGYDGKGNKKKYANIITGDASKPKTGAWNLVIDGCTFTGTFANGGVSIAFTDQNRTSGASGNVTIKNCTFNTVGAYYDIYGYYTGNGSNGYGDFAIVNNTFKSVTHPEGCPVYLGRYASSTPVVVKGNAFETEATLEDAVYVQDHSSYGVSIDASDNTFGI